MEEETGREGGGGGGGGNGTERIEPDRSSRAVGRGGGGGIGGEAGTLEGGSMGKKRERENEKHERKV